MKKAGQKPAHKAKASRDIVWKAIRELKEFKLTEISTKTKIPIRTISSYLELLTAAKILKRESVGNDNNFKQENYIYNLVRDAGLETPRVRKDGSMLPETGQVRMWRAIRVLKIFTLQEILATVSTDTDSVTVSTADTYLRQLRKAGYLRKKSNEKTYTFNPAMNYGAKAPQIQKINQVFDPNIKKVVWSDVAEVAV